MSWPVKIIRWSFYLLFFTVPLIFLPNTSELFEFNKMVAVYFFTIIISGTWVIEMILQKKFIFQRSTLDWPILIFLITQSLSLLFSIDQRTSLLGYYSRFNGGLVSMLCYSVLYWAYVTFMDRKSTMTTIYWLLTTAILVSVYGVLQHFGIDAHIWVQDVQNRVFSTLGQPNWLAAYLVALIFIPLAYLSPNPSPEFRRGGLKGVRWWLLFGLLFITLLFTKSRSGLLAFGISSVVYWGIQFINHKSKFINQFVIFSLLTLTLTLTISNPIRDLALKSTNYELPTTSSQGPALEVGGTESGIIRKIVWTGAIRIWQSSAKNFWLGSGPETFAMAYYQHRPEEHNATSEWELLYNKAHNEFLNYLATTGLLGFGSYIILLIVMAISLFKNFQFSINNYQSSSNLKINKFENSLKNDLWKLLNLGLLSGWLTLPVTNFWGFSVVVPNLLLFLLPALAVSLNTEPKPSPHESMKQLSFWQIMLFLLSLISIAYCLFSVFKYWLADVKYASGQKYLRSFTATQEPAYILSSYDNFLSAYELNRSDPPISSDLATVMAYMALMTADSDSTASSTLSRTAMLLAQKTVDTSPYHPNYYKSFSRTAIVLSTLQPEYLELARLSLEKGRSISPTDPRLLYNLSLVARYQQDLPAAEKYIDEALRLKPDFADALAEKAELATASGKISP